MSDDYAPSTETVRDAYVLLSMSVRVSTKPSDATVRAEFDRWLAAHDQKVAAEALRDYADYIDASRRDLADMMTQDDDDEAERQASATRARADQIEAS